MALAIACWTPLFSVAVVIAALVASNLYLRGTRTSR